MALRELLALFDVEIKGTEQLGQLDRTLDVVETSARTVDAAFRQLSTVLASTFQGVDGDALVSALDLSEDEAAKLATALEKFEEVDFKGLFSQLSQEELQQLNSQAEELATKFNLSKDEAVALAATLRTVKVPPALPAELDNVQDTLGPLRRGFARLKRLLSSFRSLVGVFGGIFAANTIRNGIQNTLGLAKAVGEVSRATGLSTDSVQVWQEFMRQAGVDSDQLGQLTGQLSQRILDASTHSKEMARSFQQMGVELRSSDGSLRSLDDILPDVFEKLADTTNETERLGLAAKLFGETNSRLVAGLDKGSEALRAHLKELRAVAVVYSKEFIDGASEAHDEISILSRQAAGVAAMFVKIFLPAIRWVVNSLAKLLIASREYEEHIRAFGRVLLLGGAGAMLKFGAAIFGARTGLLRFMPLLGKAARFFARWLLPLIAIEDVLTFIFGGQSLTGDAIDALFGDGTAEEFRNTVKEIGGEFLDYTLNHLGEDIDFIEEELGKFYDNAVESAKELGDEFDEMWQGFNSWVDEVGKNISDTWDDFIDDITSIDDAFRDMWTNVETFFFSVWDNITTSISDFITELPRKLLDGLGSGGGFLGDIADNVSGLLGFGEAPVAAATSNSNSVVLQDRRTISIDASGAQRGVTTRLVPSVERVLNADRNATLNAVSRD